MKNELNEKQRRFVDAYIKCPNAAQAARLAGYAEKNSDVTGAKLLVNPSIASAIEKRLSELESARTAELQETLQFLTSTMRGELTEKHCLTVGNGNSARTEIIELPAKIRDRVKSAEILLKVFGAFRAKDEESEYPSVIKILSAGSQDDKL